jgi:DNA processing protein
MPRVAERIALIALSHVSFLTPRDKLMLANRPDGIPGIFSLTLNDMGRLLGRRFITRTWKPEKILEEAEQCEKTLTRDGIGCIFYGERAYPDGLRHIYDPPLTLYFRGRLPKKEYTLIAIVGTRFPSGGARKAAFSLGFELGAMGIGVVSGLAHGIDREAHEGCVDAKGISVAVLGSGINLVYPAASKKTAAEILERGGCIVSEYPPGTPALKYNFPARNRIISGLSRGVVVIQAPERSGALITAEYALEQGRELFVHAAGIEGSAGAGTRSLADAGAPVIERACDVLKGCGVEDREPFADRNSTGGPLEPGPELARLVEGEISGLCVRRGRQTFWAPDADAMAERSASGSG